MNQSAEDRVLELELVLRDLLDNFEQTPDGMQVENANGDIEILNDDLGEAIYRATDVLEREGE